MHFLMWLAGMVLGLGLIFVSGWEVVWGANPIEGLFTMLGIPAELGSLFVDEAGDYIFGDGLMLVRFDSLFYGLKRTNKFFNSPVVSNIMLGGGIGVMILSMRSLYKVPTEQNCAEKAE